MTETASPALAAAAAAVDLAQHLVDQACAAVRAEGGVDANQVVAYDVAHAAAAVATARATLAYGALGATEERLATAFVADVLADLAGKVSGREAAWGVDVGWNTPAADFMATQRDPAALAALASVEGPRHLGDDFELVRETFHRFAEEKVRPHAEHVHRTNGDIPEEVISGLAELGGFGLSVPEEYDGFATGGESDYMGMVVATEELSWGSLGVGGSLITRPEILTRALVYGGTEDQKKQWLPKLASAEILAAVAVTEPDFGSDVAGIVTAATPAEGGWVINGVKTWCTFAARADVLMLLARTDPDRSLTHRGLSMFVVEKPRGDGHGFVFDQDPADRPADLAPGRLEGRPIDTIGYRGMHSYELAFENWFVPESNLVGGAEGLGKGFYLQMQGFENGRLQTAARALGVMQAAYEAALAYAADRVVFGSPIGDYQLTQAKLGRMAVIIQATRQSSYQVARLMAQGEGTLEASMVKAYVCRAAEWVTREAMQIHGGMGYAEEFAVSRYFVDARVLSIFEGADETLALKVIARRLMG
ncbi:MAG TPA: acyl-CoA dehydrogenase family protein [Acidimicrobiales bacterium]|jgi:(2S)-methylsuccinyl-CoA dehydrogenase|nr:acyl-CoA dehydrogenase family protein [Acidimicrobiales bacterium]